jgi:predicted transglutaminase-like protease
MATYLVKRGHNDPRVTRFAQVYLQNLEDLIHKITQYEYCRVYSNYLPELLVYNCDIRKGRELLNESLGSSGNRVGHFRG